MDWIKNALVDIGVTVLIVLAATMDQGWARWIVLVYTPLMLILKIVAFLGSRTLGHLKQKGNSVPPWFYHALYAANVGFAIVGVLTVPDAVNPWRLIAGGWALIWGLSIAADVRSRPAATAR